MHGRLNAGIEIGGTKLQLVVGDNSGNILERRRLGVAKEKGGEGIRAQIQANLPEVLKSHDVQAVGVGFGGPVDWRTGEICCSHQIEGWSGFALGAWLEEITGKPVSVDNDANVAALGEALHGAGQGFDPVFYVTLGSGVGGGLAIDGRIYHGANPGESEIGHIRLDKQGATVESRCSGWAVDAKIRQLKETDHDSLLLRSLADHPGREAALLPAALAAGDPAAVRILAETTDDLAFGLSHATHLFHPRVVILGGGLSLVGNPLRDAVASRLTTYLMDAFKPGPQISLARLGEDAVPVGTLALAGMPAGR